MYCSVCMSAEEVKTSMSIDASVSVGYMDASVDSKMSYYESLDVSTYSITVVVYSSAYSTHTMLKPETTNSAQDVFDKDGTKAFVAAYGDSYLCQARIGGEYIASYVFYCQTKESQQEFQSSLSASGVYEGVSLDGSLQDSLEEVTKSCHVQWTLKQFISGTSSLAFPETDDIVKFAEKFPAKLDGKGDAIVSFVTAGYESIPSLNDKKMPKVAANRIYFVGDGTPEVQGLAGYLEKIQRAINGMLDLRTIYAYYGGYTDATLNAYNDVAKADQEKILAQMNAYCVDPTQDFQPITAADLPSLANGTPSLQIGQDTFYCRTGDNTYEHTDVKTSVTEMVTSLTSMTSIGFYGGGDVNGVVTDYISFSNPSYPDTKSKVHGNTNESSQPVLDLNTNPYPNPPLYLKQIDAHLNGSTIRWIGVKNQAGETIGCGGSDNYTSTSTHTFEGANYPIAVCCTIHGSYLYNLGILYFWFVPAAWSTIN